MIKQREIGMYRVREIRRETIWNIKKYLLVSILMLDSKKNFCIFTRQY